MKDRFGAISKVIVIVLCVSLLCGVLLLWLDTEFNGTVGDWFVKSFMFEYQYNMETGMVYYKGLNWPRLKSFITASAIGLTAFWALTVITIYFLSRRSNAQKVTQDTARVMRDYLILDDGGVQIPGEYAGITQYLSEIKKQMQDNERLLLEEVGRKNDLVAYLAHDLKTPLTSVVGYLSLLEEAPEMPVEQKVKYVHIALDKALHLERLINEFFDITRYNLHEIVLEKERIDLSYMLCQMADEFYPLLQAHGNTITVEAREGITICADPVKLARVFNNILKNAIAYSYTNTSILIRARVVGNTVKVCFSNSGKTIPKQKLGAIFEKFYRLDDARSSSTGGAGLGLAIARDILLQHGGGISAVSEDQVTTFTVVLPL